MSFDSRFCGFGHFLAQFSVFVTKTFDFSVLVTIAVSILFRSGLSSFL